MLCRQELEAAKEGKDMYQEDWCVHTIADILLHCQLSIVVALDGMCFGYLAQAPVL